MRALRRSTFPPPSTIHHAGNPFLLCQRFIITDWCRSSRRRPGISISFDRENKNVVPLPLPPYAVAPRDTIVFIKYTTRPVETEKTCCSCRVPAILLHRTRKGRARSTNSSRKRYDHNNGHPLGECPQKRRQGELMERQHRQQQELDNYRIIIAAL